MGFSGLKGTFDTKQMSFHWLLLLGLRALVLSSRDVVCHLSLTLDVVMTTGARRGPGAEGRRYRRL